MNAFQNEGFNLEHLFYLKNYSVWNTKLAGVLNLRAQERAPAMIYVICGLAKEGTAKREVAATLFEFLTRSLLISRLFPWTAVT